MNSINAMGIAVAVLVQCNEVSDFDLSHLLAALQLRNPRTGIGKGPIHPWYR